MEIIQIRHACNYSYFIQTGGAGTSLGIWGIIALDAKCEATWRMGDTLAPPSTMPTLPRAARSDSVTITVLNLRHWLGHPSQANSGSCVLPPDSRAFVLLLLRCPSRGHGTSWWDNCPGSGYPLRASCILNAWRWHAHVPSCSFATSFQALSEEGFLLPVLSATQFFLSPSNFII